MEKPDGDATAQVFRIGTAAMHRMGARHVPRSHRMTEWRKFALRDIAAAVTMLGFRCGEQQAGSGVHTVDG